MSRDIQYIGNFDWIRRDPDLESIRGDPRYVELMKET